MDTALLSSIEPNLQSRPGSRRRVGTVMIGVPCLLVGGTEVHTLALATSLQAAGYRVIVCCYFDYQATTVKTFRDRDIEVTLLNLDRQRPGGKFKRTAALVASLARCIRRHKPDIVHVQYMTPGALGVVIARCTGVPVVVATVHVTANHYGRKVWLPKCVAAPLCNAFLCVSKVAEESFFGSSEIFSETGFDRGLRHFAIPNCVDIEAVDAARRLGPPADLASKLNIGSRPVIGILSRLDPFKGHDVLLDALALVRCDTPDALALCVGAGAGDWPDKLRRQANALGLHDHVIWAGGMTQAMAFRHLMLMDIVVMPSRPNLEGFGLVAAEAMAFEKPVIASDVDGLAEVVGRYGAGMLVPPGDVAALAGAIGQLLHDPDRRAALGIAGRNRVEKQYSMDVFADRHLRLYGKLLGGRA